MLLYATICYYILLYTTKYYYILLYTTICYYMLLYTTIYYYILLYTTIYYYILLYTTIYYYILLYTTIYYYILLYTTICYYILLYTTTTTPTPTPTPTPTTTTTTSESREEADLWIRVVIKVANPFIFIWDNSLTKLYATYYSKQLSGEMLSVEYSVLDSSQASFSDHLIATPKISTTKPTKQKKTCGRGGVSIQYHLNILFYHFYPLSSFFFIPILYHPLLFCHPHPLSSSSFITLILYRPHPL